MGLDICTIKLGKRLCDKPSDEILEEYDGEAVQIYSGDFLPIVHLPKTEPGYYLIDDYGDNAFHAGYGGFMALRMHICEHFFKKNFMDIVNNAEDYMEYPFIEMLWFTDCDGAFDYIVAGKLYEDFADYEQEAKDKFPPVLFKLYKDYMNVMKEARDMQGVVYYH